ncbi:MAG: hypothetical protein ABI261_07525 [Ginsengibacter sp.]
MPIFFSLLYILLIIFQLIIIAYPIIVPSANGMSCTAHIMGMPFMAISSKRKICFAKGF